MAYSEYPDGNGMDTTEDDYAYYEKKKPRRPRKQIGNLVSTIVIMVVLALLFLLLFNPGFRDAVTGIFDPEAGGYREYPEWAEFTVERIITATPRISGSPMDYSFDIPTPKDIPEDDPWLQDVKSVVKSPDPDSETVKYPNYTWMEWDREDVMSQQTISITYSMRTESAVWTFDSSQSGTIDDIPKATADRYANRTEEEWKIMPAHPQIKPLSDQLVAGKLTVIDKLQAIFDYLNDNFYYETIRGGEPKYCYETLKDFSGDCDDQSVLFISLARAAGIPTWLEFGAMYNSNQKTWGGHAWVRAYIPLYTGDEGYVYNIDVVNDQFLFRDALRFSEWESDGNGTHLEDYYYSSGFNFDYNERYVTKSMKMSDDIIRIGKDGRPIGESIPGFEAVLVMPAIMLAALMMRRRKRNFQ